MRLIDADALSNKLIEMGNRNDDSELITQTLLWHLDRAPSALIHCKECKYSEYDAIYGDRYCHYNGKAEIVSDEHFCSYSAERSTKVR